MCELLTTFILRDVGNMIVEVMHNSLLVHLMRPVCSQVYTLHMFQHQVDLADYELPLSVYRFDLARYLAGQPLRIMMQVRARPQLCAASRSDDRACCQSSGLHGARHDIEHFGLLRHNGTLLASVATKCLHEPHAVRPPCGSSLVPSCLTCCCERQHHFTYHQTTQCCDAGSARTAPVQFRRPA